MLRRAYAMNNERTSTGSEERYKLAEELRQQDPSDITLQHDFGNALYGYADILLNVKDPALRDWARALAISREAVDRTARKDARVLALYAQALRLNNDLSDAYSAAFEASKLLPPEEQRTYEDRQTAKEVDYELKMSKHGKTDSSKPATPKRPKPRKR